MLDWEFVLDIGVPPAIGIELLVPLFVLPNAGRPESVLSMAAVRKCGRLKRGCRGDREDEAGQSHIPAEYSSIPSNLSWCDPNVCSHHWMFGCVGVDQDEAATAGAGRLGWCWTRIVDDEAQEGL